MIRKYECIYRNFKARTVVRKIPTQKSSLYSSSEKLSLLKSSKNSISSTGSGDSLSILKVICPTHNAKRLVPMAKKAQSRIM